MSMSDEIARRRREKGWTQQELADRCEMHRATVSQIEVGLKVPSLKALGRIADALDCESADLLRETEEAAK